MTSISQVKTALKTVLAATLTSSQVVYGPATDLSTLKSRVVEVGGEDTSGVLTVDFNGKATRRDYTLIVTISVSLASSSIAAAEDQAEADHAAAITAINANKRLGFSDVSCRVDGSFTMRLAANEQGRSAAVSFPVMVVNTL